MKHIVITGSTRGIGFGMAKWFLANGCRVTLNGTSLESVDKALKELISLFPESRVSGVVADMSEETAAQLLWDKAKSFSPVDIWINNHGITQIDRSCLEIPQTEIQKVIAVNLTGMIFASQVALRGFTSQGFGTLYNMEGFGSNDMINIKMGIYGTTKRALTYFTKTLITEMKNTPVRVCYLSPGMVATDLLLHNLPVSGLEREALVRVYNILSDKVETVTPWLAEKILKNNKHGTRIAWLTTGKVIWRFMSAGILKRRIVE